MAKFVSSASTISFNRSFHSFTFMIIGSSMVQKAHEVKHFGFGIYLSDWYARLADVILRGQGGYNR